MSRKQRKEIGEKIRGLKGVFALVLSKRNFVKFPKLNSNAGSPYSFLFAYNIDIICKINNTERQIDAGLMYSASGQKCRECETYSLWNYRIGYLCFCIECFNERYTPLYAIKES